VRSCALLDVSDSRAHCVYNARIAIQRHLSVCMVLRTFSPICPVRSIPCPTLFFDFGITIFAVVCGYIVLLVFWPNRGVRGG
jgi:hypothetical protein